MINLTNFVLKIIAMVTMFCDHLGYALYSKFSGFNYIGRIAFPIFAFGISEGYKHTKSKTIALGYYFLELYLKHLLCFLTLCFVLVLC